MSQPQTYKDRTVEVRNSARAHLKELRQQRIRKRKSAQFAGRSQPGNAGLDAEQPEAQMQDGDAAVSVSVDTSANGDGEQANPPTDTEAEASGDELHDLAVENVAMSEMVEDIVPAQQEPQTAQNEHSDMCMAPDEEPDLPATHDDAAVEGAAPEASPPADEIVAEETMEASDLATLPGAGPGLVWMLGQCGVHSLGDLAQKSPEQLTSDLGVIGQILDVSQWIEFARKASA